MTTAVEGVAPNKLNHLGGWQPGPEPADGARCIQVRIVKVAPVQVYRLGRDPSHEAVEAEFDDGTYVTYEASYRTGHACPALVEAHEAACRSHQDRRAGRYTLLVGVRATTRTANMSKAELDRIYGGMMSSHGLCFEDSSLWSVVFFNQTCPCGGQEPLWRAREGDKLVTPAVVVVAPARAVVQ